MKFSKWKTFIVKIKLKFSEKIISSSKTEDLKPLLIRL